MCNTITQENETYETLIEKVNEVYELHKLNYLNHLTEKELNNIPKETIEKDFLLLVSECIK